MKLVTYSPLPSGEPRPGLMLDGGRIVDIPGALGGDDATRSMLGIIRAGVARVLVTPVGAPRANGNVPSARSPLARR